MANADDVRRLALALPDVAEIESDGFDFRVAGKGFVWSYPERRPGSHGSSGPTSRCYTSATKPRSRLSSSASPDLLHRAGYDGWPLVMLRLAEVDVERLGELVTDAWRMRAPAALAAESDEAGGPPER